MDRRQSPTHFTARTLSNVLNPFLIFTALYAAVAFAESSVAGALFYLALELLAAGVVAGYVLFLMRRSRVGDFWISRRAERLIPAVLLLAAFVGLLAALSLSGAPQALYDTTISMGLAATVVAAITLLWKASAHTAVAGHAAMAGPLVLGISGFVFVAILPLVLWARIVSGAHTPLQALAGATIGAVFAVLFLV
jgi:membrane-associated phospholipid phosphatase